MRWTGVGLLVIGVLTTALGAAAPGLDKEDAIKKDRKQYEGTWRAVTLEVDGNKGGEEDVKKIIVINHADGAWSIRLDDKEIGKGTSTIDPTQKPKTIDIKPTEGGGLGTTYFGIYEIGAKTRKVCLAPQDKQRPNEFSTSAGSGRILVTFEREKAK